MTGEKIEELDKLLTSYVGGTKSIVDTSLSRLTAPGDNYGSVLFKVDITLQDNDDDSREDLHAVAKVIPEDEFFRKIFNIQVSCKVEIAFYGTIVPTLQRFQRERGVQQVVDFFPKMLASRININGSDTVDENAVLLLENLAEQGYKNVDRFTSFDLPTTELVLKDLAAFHAVPLALKLLEPETFQSKIQPYLIDFEMPLPEENNGENKFASAFEMLYNILEADDECRSVVPQLREKKGPMRMVAHRNEPWATLGHGDFWINNTMVKFQNGKAVSNKMVDFQNPRYLSPAMDLFFFLWTSVQKDVLEEHFDDLVRFYHENVIRHLKELKCDISPFTLDTFLDELKTVADSEITHVMFFSAFVVFSKKASSGTTRQPHDMKPEDFTDLSKERLIYFIRSCKKNKWL